jgi:hypothetical protein
MSHNDNLPTATRSSEPLAFEIAFVSPTANAWAHSFLRTLLAALQSDHPQQARALALEVARTAQKHFIQHPHPKAGREACIAVGLCGLLVASYRVLWKQLGDRAEAQSLTERCLEASYHCFLQRVCAPMLREGPGRSHVLTRLNFAHWSAHLYPEIASTDGSGYEAFFRLHGVDELTDMLRNTDSAWQRLACRLSSHDLHRQACNLGDTPHTFSPFRFAVQTPGARPKAQPRVMQLVVGPH